MTDEQRQNTLRRRLTGNELVLGTMIFEFNTLGLPRIVAAAGAEFVLIDLEHTGWGTSDIRPLLSSFRAEPVLPIVRIHGAEHQTASTALDAGAGGVMAAMVHNADQAAAVVQACRFPPNGNRGFGFVYPDQLAQGAEAAIDEANEKTVVILQIESRNAVENVGAIAATPGVDGLWVGEFDLSISLGVPGEIAHQDVIAAEAAVVRTCERAGISAGVLVSHADAARDRIARGFRTIAVGSDIGLYGQALRESLGALAGQKQ